MIFMLCRVHVLGGITLGALTYPYLCDVFSASPSTLSVDGIVFIGAATLGALLPDIDSPTSFLGQKVKPISKLINKMGGHRGFTHSPIVAMVALLLGIYFTDYISNPLLFTNVIMGIFVGVMSHILLDGLNVQGIPLMYPFNKKKYRYGKIQTKDVLWKNVFELTFTILAIFTFILGIF